SNELDPDPASAADVIETLIIPAADLELEKSAPSASVPAGGTVAFTLTLLNNGPSPADAPTVTDALPSGLTFVSGSQGCSAAGAVVSCSFGTLASGATSTATITVQAAGTAAGQTLTNSASASSGTPDPNRLNNEARASVEITPAAA